MEIYFSLESLLFPPLFFWWFLVSFSFLVLKKWIVGFCIDFSCFCVEFGITILRGIRNYIGLVGKMVQLISSHRYLLLFSVRLSFHCVFFFGYVGKSCVCDSVF